MADIERKAAFYLGKRYDPDLRAVLDDEPVFYDARDLTTHAVCVGMTGSGKTGLCIDLLEEAALDGIPSIIIDPKGDMANLLLTFPDLAPSDFEPWVNLDDARRKGQSLPEYAAEVASQWARGLADSGQSRERIRRLKETAECVVYTPGSEAGVPISILQTFRAPEASWDDEEENLRELIAGTVAAILGLLGIPADPVRSREYILLAHIFEHAWRRGQDLDLARLIAAIQKPPVERLGVFDVDVFYPEKDRFDLAMRLNSVVASPSFENWLSGPPLDIARLIRTPDGRPTISIFYIAHLNEAERMFFVTLLLEQVTTWMRRQSGTTSLRALLYFDELFGYFPPHPANPPSKRPLLTLLKQARAFGLGLVLTTQNPVDLDYKGLTNAGTWFVGKLQTDRDKARLLEGMEGIVSQAGTLLDRNYLDRLISSLDSRVFLLHNVHARQPLLFKTRWTLSYLRGPLTRQQIRTLMKPLKEAGLPVAQAPAQPQRQAAPPIAAHPQAAQPQVMTATYAIAQQDTWQPPAGYVPIQPHINARVAQYFFPVEISEKRAVRDLIRYYRKTLETRCVRLVYQPYLVAVASILYSDNRPGFGREQRISCVMPLPEAHSFVRWDEHLAQPPNPRDLSATGEEGAFFAPLPDGMTDSPPYTRLRDNFLDYLYREQSVSVLVHPDFGLKAAPGETEAEFRARCEEMARRKLETELEDVQRRFERELERKRNKLSQEERELEADRIDHRGRKAEEVFSAGESLLGLLFGRRSSRRLSQASRKRRLTSKALEDVRESEEVIAKLKAEIAELGQVQQQTMADVRQKWAGAAMQYREERLRPRKSDIHLEIFGLAWMPHWALRCADESGTVYEDTRLAYPLNEKIDQS
jgi:hypothetical protein